jgi:hypothetical protein
MQPDAPVVLLGLRRVLEEVVAPAVGDGFAAVQLRAVCESLGQLGAWVPRAALLLEREHAGLCALFADVERTLDAPAAPELAAALLERLRAASRETEPAASELASRTRAQRALLCELIRALADAPPGPARDALRGRVRRELRAQLDRSLAK